MVWPVAASICAVVRVSPESLISVQLVPSLEYFHVLKVYPGFAVVVAPIALCVAGCRVSDVRLIVAGSAPDTFSTEYVNVTSSFSAKTALNLAAA